MLTRIFARIFTQTLLPRHFALIATGPLIAVVTFVLYALQRALIHSEGEYIRANTAGFLLPIGLLAAWGGRRAGGAAVFFSLCATVLCLMPPPFRLNDKLPSDWIALGFQCLAGSLLVETIHAAKRSKYLRREAQAHARQERLLNDIGHAVRASLNPEEIERAAAACLRSALHADSVFFLNPQSKEGRTPKPGSALHTQVVTDAQATELLEDTPWLIGGRSGRAWIAVPLHTQGRLAAVLAAVMVKQTRIWTPDEIALAEAVAMQAWTALETAWTLQREQRIATTLQEALQPPLPADVPGLDTDFHYKAALEEAAIGGDFYDIFPLSPETSAIVIGDVSGKGLAAAAQIAVVRNMLRYALYQGQPLGEALSQLNRTLAERDLLPGFVTLFVALFHAPDRVLTYVSCGHEPGLLRSAETGAIEELEATGPVLGVIPSAQFEQRVHTLGPGDALLLYTDGASEAGPDRSRQFGVKGLVQLLREKSLGETATSLTARVAQTLHQHSGSALHDDLCLITIMVREPLP